MKTNAMKVSQFCLAAMLVLGSLFFVLPVNAQSSKTPEERAKMLTDKMKEKLTLTDAQYQSVYDINLKYAQKSDELMKGSEDKQAKMQEFKSLQESKDKELKAVLTADQDKKYDEIKAQLKSEIADHQHNH